MSTTLRESLLTTSEVADILNVTPQVVRKLVAAGELRRIDIAPGGGKPSFRYSNLDLYAFIGRNRSGVPQVES